MLTTLYNYFLLPYADEPIKHRMKAWYGLTGMLAGFIFITIALLSHIFLQPKPFLLIGDGAAILSLITGLYYLKKGRLGWSGNLFLGGSFALLFPQTVIADGYYNNDEVSHIFHLFQTLAMSTICMGFFPLWLQGGYKCMWHVFLPYY